MPAGIITVLIALIVITPLCGFLFHCGCTWPWDGLAEHCNYFDEHAVAQCPWCASKWAGVLSVGIAVTVGYLASMVKLYPSFFPMDKTIETIVRIVFGLGLFLAVAISAGWISATLQNYHDFVFTI